MKKRLFVVEAVNPLNHDKFILGYFLNKRKAEETKKMYEYTTMTCYTKARIIVKNIFKNFKEVNETIPIVGYFAFLNNNNFSLLRDNIAYKKYENNEEIMTLKELFDEYSDGSNNVVEIGKILYTEVYYNNNDKKMEKVAFAKINNFLKGV